MPILSYILERLKVYKGWWELGGFLVVIFGLFVGANNYLDWKIEQKLSDEALLRRIGTSARPFCIFNNKGSILFDSGAMKYIGYQGKAPIELTDIAKDGRAGHITIHFNQLFTYPPIVTVIGAGLDTSRASRGPGYDWIYTMYSASVLGDSTSMSPPDPGEQDYKLEILY